MPRCDGGLPVAISTTGAVAGALLETAGLPGHQYRIWAFQGSAHTVMAGAAYLLFGGFKASGDTESVRIESMSREHVVTLLVSVGWILAAAVLATPLGGSALVAGAVLCLLRVASLRTAVQRMPWKMTALVTAISSTDLFRKRLWWGFAMVLVAAATCYYASPAFAPEPDHSRTISPSTNQCGAELVRGA